MATLAATYKEQHVFVTGATGFVGKVFIEKVLRSLPGVAKMYLLIRPKKGVDPMDRLKKELCDSPVMGRLRAQYGDDGFEEMFKRKIVAVEGSLTEERLGMSKDVYDHLVKNMTMVFHLAATIDFNEELAMSTKLNVLGSLQILALCRKAYQNGQFEAFIHVSTCYCNHARHGDVVNEVLYPLPFDAEAMTKTILNANPAELNAETPAMLKKYSFPNTYTMTKNMSEHLLNQHRGSVPMAIVRPSIIGSSLAEPFPGWVDTLSAAGALFITAGYGTVQEVHADKSQKADIIPVDYVVKGMLLAGAKVARDTRAENAVLSGEKQQQQRLAAAAPQAASVATQLPLTVGNLQKAEGLGPVPALRKQDLDEQHSTVSAASIIETRAAKPVLVYQVCSSGSENPLTWASVVNNVRAYWQQHPPEKQLRPCKVELYKNRAEFESRYALKRMVPAQLYKAQAKVLQSARPKTYKNACKLVKATDKGYSIVKQFTPFTMLGWDFMPTNFQGLVDQVLPEEAADWDIDPHHISWHVFIANYCYGIMKYIVKEEREQPHQNHVSGSHMYARANL
eukprot:TRINITY_DN1006_c0_g2_i1.p1 TRINITY_DN1006_c0_g2~~TRINITY_DN1006_c0_g2_i1.p1  ORF type:complete len:565 (+),score=259.42 TRINITY_DN1006_c0_g2_i1:114-1808(+)